MNIKYDITIDNTSLENSFKRITNQIYKLLPEREENLNWKNSLKNIIVELSGMSKLLNKKHDVLFPLLCKLEGLLSLGEPDDFCIFRRTIFECLSLWDKLKEDILCQD